MKEKSELQQFLASSSAQGQVDSHGVFTLDAEEALRKLAEHQLPFAGAWAVKIIQAIVAGPSSGSISVHITASEIRFQFSQAGFTLDEFTEAFHTPTPSTNPSLRHLLTGLWPVGLKERWRFQIALPGLKDTAIWDGERMHRVESWMPRAQVCISITAPKEEGATSWVSGEAKAGSRNADLLLALKRRCYVCPLPLSVDGVRIDCLQGAEHHGWTSTTFPLGLGYAEAPIPALRLPRVSFLVVPKSENLSPENKARNDGGGWGAMTRYRCPKMAPRESAEVAFRWVINMKKVPSGESAGWQPAQGPSTVYWVLDGALVGDEPLIGGGSHGSVGCFVNAQDLKTDLSTLRLLDSPARTERLKLVRKAVFEALGSIERDGMPDYVKDIKLEHRVVGGVVMAIGIGCFWLSVPLSAIVTLGGAYFTKIAGDSEQERVREVQVHIKELRDRLKRKLK